MLEAQREERSLGEGREYIKNKDGETQEMLHMPVVQRNGSGNDKVRCIEKKMNAVHQVLNKRHGDEATARR